jgi:CRISPR/Cas system CSM-associated protein Csm3 (group 7 of RAMP superfamily)
MKVERGVLIVRQRKSKPLLILIQINGKEMNVAQGEVSQSVLDRLAEFAGKEIEFERISGQPKKVREAGGSFIPPRQQATQPLRQKGQDKGAGGLQSKRHHDQSGRSERDIPQRQPDFHNPYNFVPTPPRNTEDLDRGDLRDQPPVDQSTFLQNCYSGSIRVKMIAKTPLLVPDTEGVQESANGHKTFPLRMDADGKPLIPASSIRGMLRSAYETITNSRFGCFSESHKQSFKYRQTQQPFRKVEFDASAWDLLHESLQPAKVITQLSPADRVFGWVRGDASKSSQSQSKDEHVAVRGLLRVDSVRCTSSTAEAVERFDPPGVPLAILASPKPQQGRFYVAMSWNGEAQDNGLSKLEAGYSQGKGLRGRKVYPQQKGLPDGHWENPVEDRTQQRNGSPVWYQEYRRPNDKDGKERDDQNHSILGWVKPGAQFSFKLHVFNLSPVELDALLWLLDLPEDLFLRFGGGKPIGFGSIRLEIESCDLRTRNELLGRYSKWQDDSLPHDPRSEVVGAFKQALVRAYPPESGSFDDISFIKAFLTACRGHNDKLPVHYPRATKDGRPGPPNPDGESFKWFVANEKKDARYALPDLVKDSGLPTLPEPGSKGKHR